MKGQSYQRQQERAAKLSAAQESARSTVVFQPTCRRLASGISLRCSMPNVARLTPSINVPWPIHRC
jgi:hypothetical protein